MYTGKEVAEEIGKLVDKHVEYVPIPVDHWIDYMKNDPYVNDFLVKHLKEFSKDIANGKFNVTNNVVKDITGHQPRSFTQYIEEHSYAFNS